MIVLKILAAPVMVALSLLAAMVTFLFCVASAVCEMGCIVLTLLSLILFIGGQTVGGIVFLVLAFLVSPFGVPAIAEWLVDKLHSAKFALRDFITGYTSGQNVPKLKRRRLTTAAVCHIGRRAAYGHDLLQEAQNQQRRNHRAVLERAV